MTAGRPPHWDQSFKTHKTALYTNGVQLIYRDVFLLTDCRISGRHGSRPLASEYSPPRLYSDRRTPAVDIFMALIA